MKLTDPDSPNVQVGFFIVRPPFTWNFFPIFLSVVFFKDSMSEKEAKI